MPSSQRVLARMDKRVATLGHDLPRYLGVFQAEERFSGPSLYFHRRAIERLHALESPAEAIRTDGYLELLYATLTAWGMHRMGPGNTKLRDFEDFKSSLQSQADAINALRSVFLQDVPAREVGQLTARLWLILKALNVSVADAKIVANSKTLHHLLPDLVPPIDRTYTYKFFYSREELTISEEDAFFEIFSRFQMLAAQCKGVLSGLFDDRWNSSSTKVLDNAIVGYTIAAKSGSEPSLNRQLAPR
jgi:hypothetical protein